jgi:hypothetical protein
MWWCACACGVQRSVNGQSLLSGGVNSCGCEQFKKGKYHPTYKGYEDLSSKYWSSVKAGAKSRKLEFSISMVYVWKLFMTQRCCCTFSKLPIRFKTHSADVAQTASLDRIDSTKGYVEGNVQWIHKDYQEMKMNKTDKHFIQRAKDLAIGQEQLNNEQQDYII